MFYKSVLEGELNAAFFRDVWSSIERLSEAKDDVVLDFSRVTFMDSHSVGALARLIRQLAVKGLRLKVTGLHGQPLRLFMVLHLIPVCAAAGDSVSSV